ncbi:MAG: glycosyltransferase involved in cell wall biosynthesis [Cryomorphaceae bacterium]|jgi:glycosyltransferase involved in cell wall biosynthesis
MSERKPYRLLVVAPYGIHLKNFLNRIESETSAIHVITSKEGVSAYPETIVDFSYRKPMNFLNTPNQIREVFKEFKPDIVHSQQLNSVSFFTMNAMRGTKIPFVATAWGSDVLVNSNRGGFLSRILRRILRSADAFTADSQEVADRMHEIAGKDLLISICNFGAEKPAFTRPKENIIYSNRLHNPLYRIDKIIRAFSQFVNSENGKNWKLIVAGSGSETEKLESLATDLKLGENIEFQGWVEKDQNAENYAKSKVWVSVPQSDATPISLLEAMYHGCYPVVISLPSIREWIEDGVNGNLVTDVNADFLGNDLNDIDENIARKNRELIDSRGSVEVATKCFSTIHRTMIQKFE